MGFNKWNRKNLQNTMSYQILTLKEHFFAVAPLLPTVCFSVHRLTLIRKAEAVANCM